jgi:hypothetical protein
MSTTEAELFNGSEYAVPFPAVDEKEVADLVVRIGGSIRLNRNDPEHAAFVESLTLGRHVELAVLASVDGKGQSIRFDSDDNESVTYVVALKAHSLNVQQ